MKITKKWKTKSYRLIEEIIIGRKSLKIKLTEDFAKLKKKKKKKKKKKRKIIKKERKKNDF